MHLAIARRVAGLLIACGVGFLAACGSGADTDTAVGSAGCPPSTRSLSVKATCVASIEWGPEGRELAIGQSVVFSATAYDAARTPITDQPLTFSSSQPAVATVSNATARGVTVTAVASGVTTLTASLGGKSSTITVTVGIGADTQVTGRVIDARTQQGIGSVSIEFDARTGLLPSQTHVVTGADGSFSFAVRSSVQSIRVAASKSGYVSTNLLESVVRPATTLPPIQLVPLIDGAHIVSTLSGTVKNARDRTPIPNAQVNRHSGQGVSATDNRVEQTTTNADGRFSFANVSSGTYTLVANAQGYASCERVAVLVGVTFPEPDQDLFCSPINDSAIRIVLTWGASPSDLDSHLTGPNADASRFHIYFPSSNRGFPDAMTPAAPWARLDTDERNGRGPETITLTQLNPGTYRYSVHDFTNRSNAGSTALGNSGAKVDLYLPGGGAPTTFFVPNQAGTLWTVFELSGDLANPLVTRRDTIGAGEEPAGIP